VRFLFEIQFETREGKKKHRQEIEKSDEIQDYFENFLLPYLYRPAAAGQKDHLLDSYLVFGGMAVSYKRILRVDETKN